MNSTKEAQEYVRYKWSVTDIAYLLFNKLYYLIIFLSNYVQSLY